MRSVLLGCASCTVLACTLITGSTSLHTESLTPGKDSGKADTSDVDNDTSSPHPRPHSDAGIDTPDSSVVAGAFCSTQTGFNQCIDFESGPTFFDSLSKDLSAGNLSLDASNTTMLLAKVDDGASGFAYARIPAGASTTHFEWSFDARLDEATQASIDFGQLSFDYGNDSSCGLTGNANTGKLVVTEYCIGPGGGIVDNTIPTEIGAVEAGTGMHRWSFVLDLNSRTYTATVKRPDGAVLSTPVLTLQTQFKLAAAPELDLGILYVPVATTPGMKVRFDNFTLKFQ